MAEILKNITVQTTGGQSVEFTNPVFGSPAYTDKTEQDNTPPSFTYFEVTNNFSATNPAGPWSIPINSYCKANGGVLNGFNNVDNTAFTLGAGKEYMVFHLTALSRIMRSTIYIMNPFYKEFYVVEFRTESHVYSYYDLSPKNYMPLPSTAASGDFLVYNGSEWAAQTVPAANGNNF